MPLLNVWDLIGTIAFALSGAMIAADHKMDIFGVNILAIVTAVGGGIVRDLLIGCFPPNAFQNPFYILISIITANICFWFLFFRKHNYSGGVIRIYGIALFWFDTLGLAAFTVDGAAIGLHLSQSYGFFFPVFLGVMTGVGGGVLRDLFSMQMPAIFVKNIYATASLAGGCVICVLVNYMPETIANIAGFITVVLIRMVAEHYHLGLPKVKEIN